MVEISIVIPVYNVEKWIDKCLQSVERQTFTNYEVIIVNDGTEDNSDKIAQRYCDKYDNWKIINTPNQGLSKARNEGLKNVNGKYIYFLDSDDYIEDDCLQLLYELAEKYQHDITIAQMKLFSEVIKLDDDVTIGYLIVKDSLPTNIKKFTLDEFPQIVWLGMICNRLYRSDFIFDRGIYFPDEYIMFEDMTFDYDTLSKAESIGMIMDKTYNYLIKPKYNKGNSLQWNYFDDENTQIKRIFDKLSNKKSNIAKALYYKWLVVDLLSAFVDYDKNTIDYDYIFNEFEKILKDIPYQILDKRIVDIWDSISERDIVTLYKKINKLYDKGHIDYNEKIREMVT